MCPRPLQVLRGAAQGTLPRTQPALFAALAGLLAPLLQLQQAFSAHTQLFGGVGGRGVRVLVFFFWVCPFKYTPQVGCRGPRYSRG